jgi:hypothetical protein
MSSDTEPCVAEVIDPEDSDTPKKEKAIYGLFELFVKELAKSIGKDLRDVLSGNSDPG